MFPVDETEIDEEVSGEDRLEGAELCLCCLIEVRPGANFCIDCGAPQGFLATAFPYQKILAEGFCYRRAVQSPRSLWSVAGVWVIFGQLVAGGVMSVMMSVELWEFGLSPLEWLGVSPILLVAAGSLVGLAGITMSTRNYLKYRSSLGVGEI